MSSGVTIYTVHAKAAGDAASLRLVPHRFSLGAFVGGPIWLALNRLWRPAAVLLAYDAAVIAAARTDMLSRDMAIVAFVVAATLVGLEGREWLRSKLAACSPMVGLAFGGSEIEALASMPRAINSMEARP